MSDIKRKSSKLNDCTLICLKLHCTGLSISSEVHVPIGKVGGSLLFKRCRHEPPKCAFILWNVPLFRLRCLRWMSQLCLLDLFLILSFLPKLTVKWDKRSRPSQLFWPATGPYWQHWLWELSVLPKNTTWCHPARANEPRPLAPEWSALTMRPPHLTQ